MNNTYISGLVDIHFNGRLLPSTVIMTMTIMQPQTENIPPRSPSCPDAILVTPNKTCSISSQNQQNHPNDQGLTLSSGRTPRREGLGRGQGSLAAATAARCRPPSPATAYQPRQTRPKNLPWQRRATHLIEIKYCEDTRPEQQLQAAHAQHGHLRRSIAEDHVLHAILLGVGGVICIPHTLVTLKRSVSSR